MAISQIKTTVIADDAITNAKVADDAINHAELNDATGIATTHHKVPSFADADARDAAISSPANGMIIYNTDVGALQQYNGAWAAISPAPIIDSISGFLNEDTDSTLSIFGSNFSLASVVKMFNASAGGTQIGSNATTTFNSSAKLTAVFGSGSLGSAGDTVYIEVDNAGVASRFGTAITLNQDPVVTHAGATGTSANTTTHLGTYGGTLAGGGTDTNTEILLYFDREDGSIDFEDSANTTNGASNNFARTGNANIAQTPFGDGKTSIVCDGTDDYIKVDKTDIVTNGGDWTLDFWVYYVSGANMICMRSLSNAGGWSAYGTSGGLNFDYFGQGGSWGQGPDMGGTTANQWVHYAVVQNSLGLSTYKNGVFQANNSTKIQNHSTVAWQDLMIGASDANSPTRFSHTYFDEIRISNSDRTMDSSDQMYTGTKSGGNFNAPNVRYTVDSNTKLLIHSNQSSAGALTTTADANGEHPVLVLGSAPAHSLANSRIASATTQPNGKDWGSVGVYFDGVGDFLYSSATNVGSGDFTYDMWMYPLTQVASDSDEIFVDTRNSSGQNGFGWMFQKATGSLRFYSPVSTSVDLVFNDNNLSLNTWTHIALERYNNVIRCYVNGVQDTTTGTTSANYSNNQLWIGINQGESNSHSWKGYIDGFRQSSTARYQGTNFTPPTSNYGAVSAQTLPTITFTGTATPALAADEDIEFTSVANTGKPSNNQHLTDSGIGLTLTNLTGGDKNKATLTGTIASSAGTSHSNMPVKAQTRKTLGNAAYNNSTTVTFSGGTLTTGLAPAMPVSGTGIPTGATISTVDSTTTITLSAATTGGSKTGQSLIFLDLTRVTHINGSDTLSNSDAMLSIATGTGADEPTLYVGRSFKGTGAARRITFNMAPDLVWLKLRPTTDGHKMFDSVRGATLHLASMSNAAEGTTSGGVTEFNDDGFSHGSYAGTNANNSATIAWCWKAGGTPSGELVGSGATMSGTSGAGTIHNSATGVLRATSITQSVSQTSGFSITKFSGHNDGVAFPHNLGGTPAFIMIKNLSTQGWYCWHQNLAATSTRFFSLSSDAPQSTDANTFSTAPSSTIITTGSEGGTGGTTGHNYVCYAWKAVSGVSAFGTYEGDGGSNRTINVGFQPKFVILKNIDATNRWIICDSVRETSTTSGNILYTNLDYAESDHASHTINFVSTGFAFTTATPLTHMNANGNTFIYVAFA